MSISEEDIVRLENTKKLIDKNARELAEYLWEYFELGTFRQLGLKGAIMNARFKRFVRKMGKASNE